MVAVATGSAGVWTLKQTNKQALAVAEQNRVTEQDRLRHDARERRYADRRDAVVAFDEAAVREVRAADDFEDKYGQPPGEVFDRLRLEGLGAPLARVAILATPEVVTAAQALYGAVRACAEGLKDSGSLYGKALRSYREACRTMLNERNEPDGNVPRSSSTEIAD